VEGHTKPNRAARRTATQSAKTNRQGPLATRDKTAAPAAPTHPAAATGSWRREDCERLLVWTSKGGTRPQQARGAERTARGDGADEGGGAAGAATGSWRREDCEPGTCWWIPSSDAPQQARGAERTASSLGLRSLTRRRSRNRLVAPRGLREDAFRDRGGVGVAATGSWRREDCETVQGEDAARDLAAATGSWRREDCEPPG